VDEHHPGRAPPVSSLGSVIRKLSGLLGSDENAAICSFVTPSPLVRLAPSPAARLYAQPESTTSAWGAGRSMCGCALISRPAAAAEGVIGQVGREAVTAAGIQPALLGLAGVVLTSTFTDFSTSSDPINNPTIFKGYVKQITVPTFVVWHQNDHCTFSPPAGSQTVFNLVPANTKASDVFQGGHSVATDPCGAFSEHGYAGIAREVVKDIAQFIKQTH
jgi:pimeloyl-ACP methyl ester carboxylesterase